MQEYSVTQLSNMIKRSIEDGFKDVNLKGEVSALKVHTSGHLYFTLKDESSNIDCVCWKFVAASQKLKLEDGMEVRCSGKVTTYPDRSKYQFVASRFELSGEGALLKLLEERKKKLAAEGIFDISKKKPLPKYPKLIGIITSPAGAVIQDMMHRIEGRFPTPILLYPTLVQGAQAAQQIIEGIKYMNSLEGTEKPDVLIVARGGGSLEDLMPFNDEDLARAVFASEIPLVSAVGHETDTTIIDYAADVRAPTPTAAAEFIVQDMMAVKDSIISLGNRINTCLQQRLSFIGSKIAACRLLSPMTLLENKMQKLDIDYNALESVFLNRINALCLRVNKLVVPKPDLSAFNIDNCSIRLENSIFNLLNKAENKLAEFAVRMDSCSLNTVFNRGFVYAELHGGYKIKSKHDIMDGTQMTISTGDGSVQFVAVDVKIS